MRQTIGALCSLCRSPARRSGGLAIRSSFPCGPSEEHPSLVARQTRCRPRSARRSSIVSSGSVKNSRRILALRTGTAATSGKTGFPGLKLLRIMQQARLAAHVTIMQEFRPPQPLYSDTAQIVLSMEGIELTPHADNLEPDGSPTSTAHRSFSSIRQLGSGVRPMICFRTCNCVPDRRKYARRTGRIACGRMNQSLASVCLAVPPSRVGARRRS
jgi:hypothetical protein